MKPPGRVGANTRALPRATWQSCLWEARSSASSAALARRFSPLRTRGPRSSWWPRGRPGTVPRVPAGTRGPQRARSRCRPVAPLFGCRNPDHDFLYEPELRQYEAIGVTRLIPAFSRLPGQPKCYVQHNILRHPTEILDLLERGAVVYVCGDAARMAPDVRAAFSKIMSSHPREPGDSPDAWFAELRANNRYVEDAWA